MKVTFLGTGTSMGVPMIGCSCKVCQSNDPRDIRSRTSVWLEINGKHIIIDSGIDFRLQALREKIPTVDAVLFTHHHADHIFGLDDLRPINFLQKKNVEIFASKQTLRHLERVYPYVFDNHYCPSDIPEIKYTIIEEKPFTIHDLKVIPVLLYHGKLPILGFRIADFAYCTDVSQIPENSYKLLKDLRVLVIGALREKPHPTHFTFREAITEAQKIGAAQTYFVHMSHELSHQQMLQDLPSNIQPAYDGLQLEI
jgi:phosphoribosyl 1,2-cyclic phosphate phosphodiesterase